MNRAIEWMAENRVAANLLMALILAAGALTLATVHLEFVPEFSLDMITVAVVYPGAAPGEVEEGVCLRIEEAIQGLEGIRKITAIAREGSGVVTVQLDRGADLRKLLDDVKSRVDAITTFPAETEKPVAQEVTSRLQVINVTVYGDVSEAALKHAAESVRDDLTALPGISLVTLSAARPYEISIEVSENDLRRWGLTFDEVADRVRRSSLDLPGGSLETGGGEILLRTRGQAHRGEEFERLVLYTRPDGTHLRLGDVATVVDGFAESDQRMRFDGSPAVLITVFRSGEQDALDIAAEVKRYVAEEKMPEGVRLATSADLSKLLEGRLSLLLRNGAAGFVLVFVALALFLRLRLAFWVSLGIPIAGLGAIALMPALDVTINMISLFAFIVVLGIVVDDAIIVGESVYTYQQRNGGGVVGAIKGAQEVARPVVFAVLTTVAAFSPLLFLQGGAGKVMAAIPLVVIPCLLFSLVESLLILPAHLSHQSTKTMEERRPVARGWRRFQALFGNGLERWVEKAYRPALEIGLKWRYATLAAGASMLLLTLGLVGGGRVGFEFFPDVESDYVAAALALPQGTPVEVTSEAVAGLEASAEQLRRELRERFGKDLFLYTSTAIGSQPWRAAQRQNAGGAGGGEGASHLGEVFVELVPAEERAIGSERIAQRWRELAGDIPDALELEFTSSLVSAGVDVDVQLTGPEIDDLRAAAAELESRLAGYEGVAEIADSYRPGKRELSLGIRPAAEVAGLTLADLGRQVRQAFYGEEVQRIQRGREELKVMVRYPRAERRSRGDLERMRIRLPDGLEVPFSEVATVEPGVGVDAIERVDRRRAIHVTADVDTEVASVGSILSDLEARVLPEVLAPYASVRWSFEGAQAQQRDSLGSLGRGFALALVAMYALLAVPLRSYAQPLVIMFAIPFGLVGAVWGHVFLGMPLTFMSMFGIVALAGVVVNDSLVMVDFINRYRTSTSELLAAVRRAGVVRFRPILLTSVTTFFALTPLLLEKSMQAKFLVPMAVSLAFGVLFATFITLVLVPAGYMVLEDLKALPGRLLGRPRFGSELARDGLA